MKGSYWIVNTPLGPYLVDKKDLIGHTVYKQGIWEPELVELYQEILEDDYTVVDVGGHMGFHTVNFAKKAKHVYTFEPQTKLYNQILGNVFLNELDEKVTCFNVGLGETCKTSSFENLDKHNSLNWNAGWTFEVINYGGRALDDNLEAGDIEIHTLDSFNISPDLIKIDVEGYELKMLQGGLVTITKNLPIILFESFEIHRESVCELLKKLNYEVYQVLNTAHNDDFIAIHPEFKDYNKVKQLVKGKIK
jgi:FkbM family methyltransferase